jgi:hypothetical protein
VVISADCAGQLFRGCSELALFRVRHYHSLLMYLGFVEPTGFLQYPWTEFGHLISSYSQVKTALCLCVASGSGLGATQFERSSAGRARDPLGCIVLRSIST